VPVTRFVIVFEVGGLPAHRHTALLYVCQPSCVSFALYSCQFYC
jgi:hypothetical protein